MNYNVTIQTTFINGITSESTIPLSTILSTFKSGQRMRFDTWLDSDSDNASTQSPYIIKTLEFDVEGKVKLIVLKEIPDHGY